MILPHIKKALAFSFLYVLAAAPCDSNAYHVQVGFEIAKFSIEIIKAVAKTWTIVEKQVDPEIPLPFMDKMEKKLFDKLNIITSKLEQLRSKVDAGMHSIVLLLQNIPERIRLEIRLNDLTEHLNHVNLMYNWMEEYQNSKDQLERLTLEDFAHSIVTHDSDSVVTLMDKIHTFLVPHGDGVIKTGILHLLGNSFQEVSDMFCSSQQSPQQVIYNLYNTIALTELKGYTMIQFSYMLLKLYGKGNFTKEAELMRTRFEQRSNNAVDAVKLVMGKASREYWKCDPKRYIKSETYEEITQLMQGYVQNEVDLNPEGTCRENCGEYQYTKSHGCFKNLFCRQQRRCNGKIINCRYVDSDMLICPASPHSGRRYEYIEYENGLVYGRKMGCMRGTTQVDSWWRWLFWHCSYCMCLCDEQGPFSDRYFNMRAAIANIANNRVITGLRFVKKNRIIHLQIQEGELMPYGSINVSSVHWVPPENYRIEDYKIYSGQDYHILTWEKRAIDLDDLVIDKDHVITGVRFKEIGSHLNFEIYVTPFNFTTGKLINAKSKSVWKDNSNTDVSPVNPRTKVRMVTPDIPTRTPSPSEMKSKSDQYVEFTHTDFERDAAQTTVPFLDTQPVDSVQPVPLSGAGIYFKGKDGFGGFIAPKIITYDYAEHLVPVFPERKKEESLHDLIEPEIN